MSPSRSNLPSTYSIDIYPYDDGWYYSADYSHSPTNNNYITGMYTSQEYRSFFVFDLTSIPTTSAITDAYFQVYTWGVAGIVGNPYNVREVTTPYGTVMAGGVNPAVYNDLGDGTIYGTAPSSSSANTVLSVTINAAGIFALNQKRGNYVVMGTHISGVTCCTDQYMFGASSPSNSYLALTITSVGNACENAVSVSANTCFNVAWMSPYSHTPSSCGAPGTGSYGTWYSYYSGSFSGTVTVSTCQPPLTGDTVVEVYTGCSSCVTWVDDDTTSLCPSDATASTVTFTAAAMSTYNILVRAYSISYFQYSACLTQASFSPTPSRTPSVTLTPTRTPSVTSTSSVTPSVSLSPTQTPTKSPSPTPTPSGSTPPSGTPTATATASASDSASSTTTSTATTSPSTSGTPSTSATPSASVTPLPSVSATSSGSLSASTTTSPTASVTSPPSATTSASASPSPSLTRTTSPTASETQSPSTTESSTESPSLSHSSSTSASATATLTASSTVSVTPSASVTPTATQTATQSTSASLSATPSETLTPSVSPTASSSTSGSPSSTATATATRTVSVTPTTSSTPVQTPSPSAFVCGRALPGGVQEAPENNDTSDLLGAVRLVVCTGDDPLSFNSTLWCTRNGWSVAPAESCLAHVSCAGDGTVYRSGACRGCPMKGSFCPGGHRIWPRAGYWSYNEDDTPLRCRNEDACVGALQYSYVRSDGAGRETRFCASGYTGDYCAYCSPGYYRAFEDCIPCPKDASVSLTVLIVAAVILYSIMAVGVASLPVKPLGFFVTGLVAFQQLTLVGRLASSKVAGRMPWLATALNYLSVLSFSVEFASPECSTSTAMDWTTLFWATLVVAMVVTGMFVLASALRAAFIVARRRCCIRCLRKSSERYASTMAPAGPPKNDGGLVVNTEPEIDVEHAAPKTFMSHFGRRAVRSALIAATVLYFQICTRVFEGLSCVRSESGARRLRAQLTITCFESDHLSAFAVAVVLLMVFCVGFPLWCLFMLRRFYHRHELGDNEVDKRWGSLYSAMRHSCYWFKTLSFTTTFIFTCVAATTDGSAPRLLASGVLFAVSLVFLIILLPYERRLQNVWMSALSFCKMLLPAVLLGAADPTSAYFLAMAGIAATVVAVTVAVLIWRGLLRDVPCVARFMARCKSDTKKLNTGYNPSEIPHGELFAGPLGPPSLDSSAELPNAEDLATVERELHGYNEMALRASPSPARLDGAFALMRRFSSQLGLHKRFASSNESLHDYD